MGKRSGHGINDGLGNIPGSTKGANDSVFYGFKMLFLASIAVSFFV
jgi:hypothetical protein